MNGILELAKTKERVPVDTNCGIEAEFVPPPSDKLREIGKILFEKDREVYKRLKELGD